MGRLGCHEIQERREVYGRPDVAHSGDGYAEYVIFNEQNAAFKPRSLDHVHAATLPVVELTAWQALFDEASLNKGQEIRGSGRRW
jgi:NADPH:quinone reductase-like Zn-dependent oxidoreductase